MVASLANMLSSRTIGTNCRRYPWCSTRFFGRLVEAVVRRFHVAAVQGETLYNPICPHAVPQYLLRRILASCAPTRLAFFYQFDSMHPNFAQTIAQTANFLAQSRQRPAGFLLSSMLLIETNFRETGRPVWSIALLRKFRRAASSESAPISGADRGSGN